MTGVLCSEEDCGVEAGDCGNGAGGRIDVASIIEWAARGLKRVRSGM